MQQDTLNAQHFLLGKQSQLLAVLVGYRERVPKSSLPATQAATSQVVPQEIQSQRFHRRFKCQRSALFALQRSNHMWRMKEEWQDWSSLDREASEHHQLYRKTWAKQFNFALLLLKKGKKKTSIEKSEHQANGEHILKMQMHTVAFLSTSSIALLPLSSIKCSSLVLFLESPTVRCSKAFTKKLYHIYEEMIAWKGRKWVNAI